MSNTLVQPRYEDPTRVDFEGLGHTQAISPVEGYSPDDSTRIVDDAYAFDRIVELTGKQVDPSLASEDRVHEHMKLITQYYDWYHTGQMHLMERAELSDSGVQRVYSLESPDFPHAAAPSRLPSAEQAAPTFIQPNRFEPITGGGGVRLRMRHMSPDTYTRSEDGTVDTSNLFRGAQRGMPGSETLGAMKPRSESQGSSREASKRRQVVIGSAAVSAFAEPQGRHAHAA